MLTKNPEAGTLVPVNIEGKPVDLERSTTKGSIGEAVSTFTETLSKLLKPDRWKDLAGFKGAAFKLQKRRTMNMNPEMELYDYVKIDIPGPGPKNGDGYDWVIVEKLEKDFDAEADESFGIRLRACSNPNNKNETETAHFFRNKATSTFLLKRKGDTVSISYHGRNETPNVSKVKIHDKIRNSLVALGALGGLSELQWSLLLDGFLE